jgi:hypothetical protein
VKIVGHPSGRWYVGPTVEEATTPIVRFKHVDLVLVHELEYVAVSGQKAVEVLVGGGIAPCPVCAAQRTSADSIPLRELMG